MLLMFNRYKINAGQYIASPTKQQQEFQLQSGGEAYFDLKFIVDYQYVNLTV
jgi:hypothetical protein